MYKLLIVDDERDIRIGLGQYFPWNTFGYEVVNTASNAKDALQIIESTHIDVMLCDIKMPGLNGLDLIKFIRQKNYPLSIVLLSGYGDFEYAQKAMELGVKRFLLKPTKHQELIDVFQQLHKELALNTSINEPEPTVTKSGKYDLSTVSNSIIQLIVQYIDQHFQTVSLDTVAAHVNMKPSYVSSFFKEKTGINFSDYVNYIRMENAANLLLTTTYRSYEISDLVGYANPKHFSKKFQSYHGISPIEYRNRGKSG